MEGALAHKRARIDIPDQNAQEIKAIAQVAEVESKTPDVDVAREVWISLNMSWNGQVRTVEVAESDR